MHGPGLAEGRVHSVVGGGARCLRSSSVVMVRRVALVLFAVTASVACSGLSVPELGGMECREFGVVLNARGELAVDFNECSSNQGPVALRAYVQAACRAECLVFRFNRGIDKTADWAWTVSCAALPASTSTADDVGAFVDDLCGWRVKSWEVSAVAVCEPGPCGDGSCEAKCVNTVEP